jgi:hypothetical protein
VFTAPIAPIGSFEICSAKRDGKEVRHWFARELFTTYADETREGEHTIHLEFDQPRNIEIEGKEYEVKGIACVANRIYKEEEKMGELERRRTLRLAYPSIHLAIWRNHCR